MTKVVVKAGACGFTSVIIAEKGPERMVDISVESGCAMVQKMAVEIARLGRRDALTSILTTRSTAPQAAISSTRPARSPRRCSRRWRSRRA